MSGADDIRSVLDRDESSAPEHRLDFLRALVDATVDAIIVHEPEGRIVFYNQGALAMLRMTPEEMESLPPFGWVGPDSLIGSPGRLEAILHDGRKKFMSSARCGNGCVIPTEVVASSFATEQGPLVVAVIRDVSERAQAENRLEYLAYHDSLTGLANRTAFDERLRVAIADCQRYGDLLILAYLDLDHFKPVNDRFGHAAGDQVLIEIARRLLVTVRAQDVVARLGGDEFVVLLQRAESIGEIVPIAERLLAAMRRPVQIDAGEMVCVDASIGFAVFDRAIDDARSLVVKADIAMYEAKRDPGHDWLLYHEAMGGTDSASGSGLPPLP
jgi:diguanylate cyclase (GGDEF)-like protein/PAS domain S-box-containing protein